ncbi:LPS export ABC transporter ATP-binding protein [Candidatus Macondimonas diazotrophica]|jgi:lipopolysaccharide export system ATP-binding protein|uniref:Lipopolysaccharide export system ATP-binding protein LptB n=1 Tax=Candidatus Macondimonas diazotrophica TaxID=2305248 RepID=A0A4Z0FD37_9GAMM|nr:LPS export ABC transporter ATP-binding protein [Candidatus Macondimonas diazotrophica]NCT99897.1 LPS export ABC transporter ATP-binding protein [Candidatus Macondimonas diazotrophica]TFZ83707.1 LPS export ABC transporter ATP-binding protein [Candidatus Macondimonas diazotrophica]HBG29722.1 LPS export ABC transporter ATP-binding protein [Gammaproteobacteria bacterium]HBG50188.1 LPS export ABC transporter ATP-binding protein [Gammaproteobacteria bacterium]
MSCVLEADTLTKRYRNRSVVNEVSLRVQAGEVVGLLGPNGAGKTTMFYMMAGLVRPDRGRIMLSGEEISDLPIHLRARRGIGYLPQEASVFRRLTVAENILAILELRPTLSATDRKRRCQSLLEEFHIAHLRDSQGMSLSGGERRRLEIARALAAEPSFILLDEPFAGVDPISVVDIQRIVTHLRDREIGVLITDHNVRETLHICERAYILSEGSIIAQGEPDQILADKTVREVYLGQAFQL